MDSYIRKSFLLLACALFLVSPFTACGSTSNSSNSEENDTNVTNVIKFETFADSISLPPVEDMPYNFHFTYSISWPVSGNNEIVKFVRQWIAEQMNCKNISDIDTQATPDILIKEYTDTNLDDCGSTELTVGSDISGDILSLYYSTYVGSPMGRPIIDFQETKINLSNGKVLTRDLFPSDEIMSNLILEGFKDASLYDELDDLALNLPLPFPSALPSFDENGLFVQYKMYEVSHGAAGMPSTTIIYSKILPYLSDDLLEFVPKEYYEKYKAAPVSNKDEIEKEISKFVYSLFYDQSIVEMESMTHGQCGFSPKMKETFKEYGITSPIVYNYAIEPFYSSSFTKLLKDIKDKEQKGKEVRGDDEYQIFDFDWWFFREWSEEPGAFEAKIDDIKVVNPGFAEIVVKYRDSIGSSWNNRKLEVIKEDGQWKVDNINKMRQQALGNK